MIEGLFFVTIGIAAYFANKFIEFKKENQELKLMIITNKYTPKDENDTIREDFLKFLSESRDWAFEYIEDVQSGLENFINDVDHHINHFDEYGSVLSEGRPDYLAMKQISKSYKELKKLLPEDLE